MISRKKHRISEVCGNLCYLQSETSKKRLAVLKGKMRIMENVHISKIPFRNPVCVGDYVIVQEIEEPNKNSYLSNQAVIEEVLPRNKTLIRSTPTEIHLLGSNIDFAVCIVSLVEPEIRTGFIDRFLIACFSENITPILFFTKCDLLKKEKENHKEYVSYGIYYQKILPFVFWDNLLQVKNYKDFLYFYNESKIFGFEDFKNTIKEGTLITVGQSGTGKSTFINLILGSAVQKVNSVSSATKKGKHTTTSSILFSVSDQFSIIDTPGVREWGLYHLTEKKIYESYPEFSGLENKCKFKNCSHLPKIDGCAIQKAIREGILPEWRKENLESIIKTLEYYEKVRYGDYKKPTGKFYNRI